MAQGVFLQFKAQAFKATERFRSLAATGVAALCLVLGAGTASSQTLAPVSKEELRKALVDELPKFARNKEALERIAQQQYPRPLTAAQLSIVVRQLKVMYEHPDLPDTVAGLIAPILREGITQAEYAQALSASMMSVPVRGLVRMDAEAQRFFVGYTNNMLRAVPPEVCKKIQLQQYSLPEMARIERAYIQSLPLEAFEQTTQLFLTSALAEISKANFVRKPTSEQVQVSEKIWRTRFESIVQSRLSAAAIARVGNNMEAAPATEVCEVGRAVMQAMLDMEEPYRTWRISTFMGALQ